MVVCKTMSVARRVSFLFMLFFCPWQVSYAQWAIHKGENDSIHKLLLRTEESQLTTSGTINESQWTLPYPVYQFQTGDVDGDGSIDALVGVIKPTRFYPTPARRIFVFKNYRGRIRPLWMGSKLGGILEDFRWADGRLRSLERTTDDRFFVCEYTWNGFGFSFLRFVVKNVSKEEALPFL